MEAALAESIDDFEKGKLDEDVEKAQKESVKEDTEQILIQKALKESQDLFESQFAHKDEEELIRQAMQESGKEF
jgi:hypothetical protein